jgi:hypothetical protein
MKNSEKSGARCVKCCENRSQTAKIVSCTITLYTRRHGETRVPSNLTIAERAKVYVVICCNHFQKTLSGNTASTSGVTGQYYHDNAGPGTDVPVLYSHQERNDTRLTVLNSETYQLKCRRFILIHLNLAFACTLE